MLVYARFSKEHFLRNQNYCFTPFFTFPFLKTKTEILCKSDEFLKMNVMQIANFSRKILRKKLSILLRGKYSGENFAEILHEIENLSSWKICRKLLFEIFIWNIDFVTYLKPAFNNGLHQLLGLRLLFLSSWKIIWWQQLYLSQKFCSFVLVSDCSSNWCKPHTLAAIFPQNWWIQ